MNIRYNKRLSAFLAFIMVLSSIITIGMPNVVLAEGNGTWDDPYNVEQAIELQDSTKATVAGYIVGEPTSEKMVLFEEFKGDTAIAIADSPSETDTTNMLYIQIPIGNFRTQFGLSSNPNNIGKYIKATGSLEPYFTPHPGLKSLSAMEFAEPDGGEIEEIPVESIGIEGPTKLAVDKTIQLGISYTPSNTTEKGVDWTSSDDDIATVDKNGKVIGIAEGEVTITATSKIDTDIDATHDITVNPAEVIELMSIEEARKKSVGETVIVEGVITFIDSNNNNYIQDDTAAIDIYMKGQSLGLVVGDKAKVTGKLETYNGLLEVVPASISDVEKLSSENPLPEPKIITIPKINEYQSQRIKIEKIKLGTINTGANTEITDLTGNKANIYKIPELTHVKAGDLVDVIAIASIFNSIQLRVRQAEDIAKVDIGPDENPPVVEHTQVAEGNINLDLQIKTKVTDDREIKEVKLYYRTTGEAEYKSKKMSLSNEEFIAIIPKAELSEAGLEYYIWATDGTNEITSPEDINIPYIVEIKTADILPPTITSVEPKEGTTLEETNTKPKIKAVYEDPSGIDITSVQIILDSIDVTKTATVSVEDVNYTPIEDLTLGNHTVTLKVKDTLGNEATKTWTFTIGELEYQFRFGQLHSHTNLSDGTGTPDDAYAWARDRGKADFFAVTDHSNWFDNDLNSENITSVSDSTSSKWKTLNSKADEYNDDNKYVAIAGYEMTWSGSTGGWGHINTFNTPWFASRTNKAMDLPAYYKKIAANPESISQLNHPGKTFGDFADFGYYSEAADNVVQLIEVGNGEGPIRGSGYFPSYEYYTRALDKGWHLAPSNNQDNHKGNWITSNDARTVILSDKLTRDGIYDGIRDMRVYATENKNLEIMYKINGEIMGSRLDSPDKLEVSININEPDTNDSEQKITKVELISNGGIVSANKTFDDYNVDWNFELDPMYDYYYVKVTQANRDISVTSPIWVGEVLSVGLESLDVSSDYFELGTTIDLTATVYNNSNSMLDNAKVEFYVGNISEGNKIGEDTLTNIASGSKGKAVTQWKPDKVGNYNLYAVATIDGVDKTFTLSKRVEAVTKGSSIKVMVDHAHSNHYVSGDYKGMIKALTEMLKNKKMILLENHDTLTEEALKDIDILIITSPQPRNKYEVERSKLSNEEIQAVADFTDRGGSLIITSRANYGDGTGDYQNSIQGNKVLNAIGSNLIFNSDQVVDYVKNGGQQYRLYLDNYTSHKYNLTPRLGAGDEYSFYSGCSVLLKEDANDEKVDFLVKGHSTTKNENAGNTPTGFVQINEGEVYTLAAEVLPSGAKVIVSGSAFFSDFEMSGDDRYSNVEIAENILEWLKPENQTEIKTIKEVRDGMPDNFGQEFTIEGRITAMSEAYAKEKEIPNAFFEVIYVQDETGGLTVFGVSQSKLPLGTKIRITGIGGEYEGDYQLQIRNETLDLTVLDDSLEEVEPKLMSTADSMKKPNEGWLVKIKGKVSRIDNGKNSLYIKDESNVEARVYVNGYIGDDSGDESTLGKWDPNIKVGDTVSAIGLASTDPEGPRLRVRNTAEIVRIVEVDTKYPISKGTAEILEGEEKVTVKVNIDNVTEEDINGIVIIKLIDKDGRAYRVKHQNLKMKPGQNMVEFTLSTIDYPKGIKEVEIYIWDSLEGMKPLADI